MAIPLPAGDIAHVIQLSVAPVFLLTGIGAILSVLSHRISRVVDRARVLEERLSKVDKDQAMAIHVELGTLARRARLVNLAITLCTMCALLVCTVIALLFIGAFMNLNFTAAVAWLFIACMAILIAGLLVFLKEIRLAIASLRIGPH
jgi:hypothetical protein